MAEHAFFTDHGAQVILHALRGSTTQQIVRRAPCPVLAIPHDF